MRKICKGLSIFMVVLSVLVSSFFIDFESSAANLPVYYMPYNEPSTSSNQGYANLLVDLSNGKRVVYSFIWSITMLGDLNDTHDNSLSSTCMDVNINATTDKFTFTARGATGETGYVTMLCVTSDGFTNVEWTSGFESYASKTFDFSSHNVVGYQVYGNFGTVSENFAWGEVVNFNVMWAEDEKYIDHFVAIMEDLTILNSNLGGKLDTLVSRVNALISEVDNVEETLVAIRNLVAEYYPKFETELQNIVDRLDTLIEQSADDKNATDKFEEDSSAQSDKINDLNAENKVDKTDVDSASGSVDEYIDGESIASYGTLLSVFTNNEYILRMILIVLAIGLISYVLFGKR